MGTKRKIKPIFDVILILILCLVVHTWYSTQEESLNIGIALKQSKMGTYFTHINPADSLKKDHLPTLASNNGKNKAGIFNFKKPLHAKKDKTKVATKNGIAERILVAGDSMAGAAGLEYGFSPYINFNKHTVNFVSFASSSTKTWSEEKKLRSFIEQYNPTYIIMALGSNELFVRDLEDRDRYIKDIIEQAGDIPLVWVGPPNWRKDTGINQLIKDNICEACFFDSQNLSLERQPDGIHPSMTGSTQWAEKLADWLMNESRYPITMSKPK